MTHRATATSWPNAEVSRKRWCPCKPCQEWRRRRDDCMWAADSRSWPPNAGAVLRHHAYLVAMIAVL